MWNDNDDYKTNRTAIVELRNVQFSYVAPDCMNLQTTSLEIRQGECILICGASGCGKTTMTKLINGLIPHFYEGEYFSGDVLVKGSSVSEMKMYELANLVGSVFQNPKSQFFHLDSDSELAFGLENAGMNPKEMEQRVKETVEDLQIQSLEHRSIFAMSGGEKQSLAFASVYAMRPQIFVLDEPTANLDDVAIERLRRLIAKGKENGHTVMIAEHRLHFLEDIADRVVYMKNGNVERIFDGEEFFRLEEHERIALGLRSIQKTRLHVPLHLPDIMHKSVCFGKAFSKADLCVEGLCVSYGQKEVLRELHFSANFGDIVGIVGKNGAGKSTFCHCLCGLLKKRAGSIRVQGKEQKPKQLQRLCALVMQDVNHQLFSDSVWEECTLSNSAHSDAQVTRILKDFDLWDYRDAHPMALSGGQKQRLAIATAVLSEKRILIFDEPTSGLDYRHMQEVSQCLKSLAGSGCMVLVVSHDVEFLNETCASVFMI